MKMMPKSIKKVIDKEDDGTSGGPGERVCRKKSLLGSVLGSIMRRSTKPATGSSSLRPKVPDFDDASSMHSTHSAKSSSTCSTIGSSGWEEAMPSAVQVEASFADVALERFGSHEPAQFATLSVADKWHMVQSHRRRRTGNSGSSNPDSALSPVNLDMANNVLEAREMVRQLADEHQRGRHPVASWQRFRVAVCTESIAWIKQLIADAVWSLYVDTATDHLLHYPYQKEADEVTIVLEIAKTVKAFASCTVGLQHIMRGSLEMREAARGKDAMEKKRDGDATLLLCWLLIHHRLADENVDHAAFSQPSSNQESRRPSSRKEERQIRHAMLQLMAVFALYDGARTVRGVWRAWRQCSRLVREGCLGERFADLLAEDIQGADPEDQRAGRHVLDSLILLNALISSIDPASCESEEEKDHPGMDDDLEYRCLRERMSYRTILLKDRLSQVLLDIKAHMSEPSIWRQLDFMFEDAAADRRLYDEYNSRRKHTIRPSNDALKPLERAFVIIEPALHGPLIRLLTTLVQDVHFEGLSRGCYPSLVLEKAPTIKYSMMDKLMEQAKQDVQIEALQKEVRAGSEQKAQHERDLKQLQAQLSLLESEKQDLLDRLLRSQQRAEERHKDASDPNDHPPDRKTSLLTEIKTTLEDFEQKLLISPPIAPPPPLAPPLPMVIRAPPAAPPPPPSRMVKSSNVPKGVAEEQAEPKMPVPRCRMRPLPWTKIPETHLSGRGYVWHQLADKSATSTPLDVDYALLEKHFCLASASNANSSAGASHCHANNNNNSSFLGSKAATNLGIALKRLRGVTPEQFRRAVRNVDAAYLDEQLCQELLSINLSADELEHTRHILDSGEDTCSYALTEQYVLALHAVPLHRERLQLLLFVQSFAEWHHDLLQKTEQFVELLKTVQASNILGTLLSQVLRAGNFLNHGTFRGNAQAFHLDILDNLSGMRSNESALTLLEAIIPSLVDKEANLEGAVFGPLKDLSLLHGLTMLRGWREQVADRQTQLRKLQNVALDDNDKCDQDDDRASSKLLARGLSECEVQLAALKELVFRKVPEAVRSFYGAFGLDYNLEEDVKGAQHSDQEADILTILYKFTHECQRLLVDLRAKQRRQLEDQERKSKRLTVHIRQLLHCLQETDRTVVDSVIAQLRASTTTTQ